MAAAAVATDTEPRPYPELEAIPPAPPRSAAASTRSSASSLLPVPNWVVRLFSAFPLHVWPEADVISPAPSPPPRKPTLYVAPHLNRDGTLSPPSQHASTSKETLGWTSSDPTCLRWQLQLLFRGVDFDVEFIDPSQSWGPGGQLPFLHLPPAFQPPSTNASSSSRSWLGAKRGAVVPSLLTAAALPHFLDNHFPLWRPELGEKADANPLWKDKATELESRTWINLLSGRVMAGVLQTTFLDDQLRRISALNPKARSQPTSRLPGWEVGFLGWVGAHSMGAGAGQDAATGDGEDSLRYAAPVVDENKVVDDAVKGIEALGLRTQADLEGAEGAWMLGASQPTELDALTFAIVHSVMSLSATPAFANASATTDDDRRALLRLKAAIEGKPWLVGWSRRVWKDKVRPKERGQ
ncbi:uncharacterized protein PSFLO_05330 [Pseudozyma flocculosa]|uniref:Metaxin glutathione S-transferase domain-containing protein n=1 Tax=Pseudozyma flocculosa TaxID=84751 RepID=A0A5C3F911_9BASI|nr:uncharacterized protein PSFLO_05330 [Pseudozyma flocculosa]